MNLKKVSYKKLRKETKNKFSDLCKELFPDLKFSRIKNNGYIGIRERDKFFSFMTNNNKHIQTVLFTYMPYAIALNNLGNASKNNVDHYRNKIELILSRNEDELDNIKSIINLFYNETFNRSSILENITENKCVFTINEEIIERIVEETPVEKGTADFLTFLFGFPSEKIKRNKLKKVIIITCLATIINTYTLFIELLHLNGNRIIDNFCMRAPPSLHIILYNST